MLASHAWSQDVRYEKHRLENGLTVILHEDHSLPIASVNVWYRVGSKDEPPRRSGFAHLFEHLMFMGTRRVPGSDFDNLMEAGGGYNNASTSEDRTNYYSIGPANLLPTLLWLEADRLEDLAREMNKEKLDKQRDVVRNERRQSYEIAPYGMSELRVYEEMFPKGHPYHIPVIGTHEDLEAATVEDVKSFFNTYYVPCNASLVVSGDFNSKETLAYIQKLFGSLPRGSEPAHATAEPMRLHEVKRVTMSDQVQYPKITYVYHSPAYYSEGDAEMDLAAAVLSDGLSSRLYQALIYQPENPLAVDVSAYQSSMQLGSLFYVEITTDVEQDLDAVEKATDQVLAEFIKKGPTKEELDRQKAQIETGMLSRLQSTLELADQLNEYEYHFGEPNSFKRDLDRYRNATTEGVRERAEKVLTPDARLVVRVLPEIKAPPSNPRDDRPTLAGGLDFKAMEPVIYELDNGIEVRQWVRPQLPLTYLSLLFEGGSDRDPNGASGLAEMTGQMLTHGAGDLDAVAFENALEQLGAEFSPYVNTQLTTLDLQVLSRNLDEALRLVASAAAEPRMDKKEWRLARDLQVDELKSQLDSPASVATLTAFREYFGAEHPFGRSSDGKPEDVEKMELDSVKSLWRSFYRPERATLFIAGDLKPEEAKTILNQQLGGWRPATAEAPLPTPAAPKIADHPKLRVILVDRPGAVQTVIRFLGPGLDYQDERRPAIQMLNTILGGSFTSRLNQNLREAKGYTYGARSSFAFAKGLGYFTAFASVRADVTGASLKEFFSEFDRICQGTITDAERDKARWTVYMDDMQSFESLDSIVDLTTELAFHDRTFKDWRADLERLGGVTTAQLNELAKQTVRIANGVLVLVGDKKTIVPQLKEAGITEWVERTADGKPAAP